MLSSNVLNIYLRKWEGEDVCDYNFMACIFLQELEDLRKQGEIIPQLMTECETVSQKLQV